MILKAPKSVFLFFLLSVQSIAYGEVFVERAWVAAPPPGSKVLAAYMRLHNSGDGERALLSVTSNQFEKVEIHNSTMKDGMMRMEHLSSIAIPARGSVELSSGGLHMMLMGPERYFKAGDRIQLNLMFDDSSVLNISVPVKRR